MTFSEQIFNHILNFYDAIERRLFDDKSIVNIYDKWAGTEATRLVETNAVHVRSQP